MRRPHQPQQLQRDKSTQDSSDSDGASNSDGGNGFRVSFLVSLCTGFAVLVALVYGAYLLAVALALLLLLDLTITHCIAGKRGTAASNSVVFALVKAFLLVQVMVLWCVTSTDFFYAVHGNYASYNTVLSTRIEELGSRFRRNHFSDYGSSGRSNSGSGGSGGSSTSNSYSNSGSNSDSVTDRDGRDGRDGRDSVGSPEDSPWPHLYPVRLLLPAEVDPHADSSAATTATVGIRYASSAARISAVVGPLLATDFPDLRYWPSQRVRRAYKQMFSDMPKLRESVLDSNRTDSGNSYREGSSGSVGGANWNGVNGYNGEQASYKVDAHGFNNSFRNPCWIVRRAEVSTAVPLGGSIDIRHHGHLPPADRGVVDDGTQHSEALVEYGLVCLPYAYILGQPKCGTSDLFVRLSKHQAIR